MDRLLKFIAEYGHRVGTPHLRGSDGLGWVVDALEHIVAGWAFVSELSPSGLDDNQHLYDEDPIEAWLTCQLVRLGTLHEISAGAKLS
jgi:hypothetical protein